jgi:predicted site-specific integrase-resolvase
VQELADTLEVSEVSEATVRRWIKSGELRAIDRLGRF